MSQHRTRLAPGADLDADRADVRRAAPAGRHALLDLQRAAGNRAVAQLVGGRRPAGTSQRYTTTDSVLANAASLIGLGSGAAALTGAVTFETSGFTAAAAAPLTITKTGTDLSVASATYTAGGTVKASGPAAAVGDYELGFLQTVYESTRTFYYEPPGHTPGILDTLLPAVFSDRRKVSDTLSTIPVRDGDAGFVPWYGPETVVPFDAADPSTKATAMSDTPSSGQPWTIGTAPNEQHLVKTDGKDRFRSWLAVKHKTATQVIPLHWAAWEVDYSTTVAVNTASPASSVVTPAGSSGAKVTAQGEGSGGWWPLHGDPVANDVAHDVEGAW
jgi:hypothetical protein